MLSPIFCSESSLSWALRRAGQEGLFFSPVSGADRAASLLPGSALRAVPWAGWESVAACGAGAGAGAAAAPAAAGAAGAAAPGPASGWARTGAGAAPAPPAHGPWAQPASPAPPLQRHEHPTVRHAQSSWLEQEKKSITGYLTCHSQVVPAVSVKSKNHLCLHLPGQRERFWLPGGARGTWTCPISWGKQLFQGGHPHPEPLLLEAAEGKVRSNPRLGFPDTWKPEMPFASINFHTQRRRKFIPTGFSSLTHRF